MKSLPHRYADVVRWTARVWSVPVIALTFLLAGSAFIPHGVNVDRLPLMAVFSSLYSMAFAVAFVVAWHWERTGAWIALLSAVAFKFWFSIQWGHLAVGLFDLIFWIPAILFLTAASFHGTIGPALGPASEGNVNPGLPTNPRRYFALPRTNLGWVSLLVGAGFFLFLRLFWMQAGRPGRDRSTFFSDPINATCLIGAFATPIIGMLLALVAIIWKRERSLLFIPLLLLGLFALFWAIAVLSGANA